MSKSWKTTLGGVIALIGGALTVLPDDAPGAKYCKPWAVVVGAIGTGIVGLAARDNDKTSEDVGTVTKSGRMD